MTRPVELVIDRLILDGVAVADRARLTAAIEAELARLLADGDLRPFLLAGGPPERLPGGRLRIGSGQGDAALGTEVARAIYGTIGVPLSPAAAGRPLTAGEAGWQQQAGASLASAAEGRDASIGARLPPPSAGGGRGEGTKP